jgi:hypothetical protein
MHFKIFTSLFVASSVVFGQVVEDNVQRPVPLPNVIDDNPSLSDSGSAFTPSVQVNTTVIPTLTSVSSSRPTPFDDNPKTSVVPSHNSFSSSESITTIGAITGISLVSLYMMLI